jgi:hypothetical protein
VFERPEWHDEPFEGAIACTESSFPFITFSNANEVMSMLEIDFGIDLCSSWCIEEVRNER